MKDTSNDLLLLVGKVLAIMMQFFLAIGGLALLVAIPVILFAQGAINAEIVKEYGNTVDALPIIPTIALCMLAFAIVALAFVFFGKLRAIIATVGDGDPFDPENADRLSLMGWLMLGCQLLLIPAAGLALILAKWADAMENAEVTVDVGLDLGGILLVIVLFILARVFKHGAAMREDLEGTV